MHTSTLGGSPSTTNSAQRHGLGTLRRLDGVLLEAAKNEIRIRVECLMRIDGAIVLDRTANLLAFGAILRHQLEPGVDENSVEGGRTSAAIAASRYGHVLKVSEDGLVSYYSGARCVWEL